MADQGRWWKLWCSALSDPDLENLSLEDWARYCRFGAYVKEHGNNGVVMLSEPGTAVRNLFRLSSLTDVINTIRKFPNFTVTGETIAIVTVSNWQKYQGDNSADRTRAWRQRVTPKKRREEIKKRTTPLPPTATASGGEVEAPDELPLKPQTPASAPAPLAASEPCPPADDLCPACLAMLAPLETALVRFAPFGPRSVVGGWMHGQHDRFGVDLCVRAVRSKVAVTIGQDRQFLHPNTLFKPANFERAINAVAEAAPRLVHPRV